MPSALLELISLDETPYYHCINRSVGCALLCGDGHREPLIVERIKILSNAFAIEACGYAIMSNHYHLAARVNRQQSQQWTPQEVIER